MKAADSVEKITQSFPEFLIPHQHKLIELILDHPNTELKWHLAHLVTRFSLNESEFRMIWAKLRYWIVNPNESKLVRVNSLQAIYDLMKKYPNLSQPSEFKNIVRSVEQEHIPSITARIKKLRREVLVERGKI